MIEKMTKYSFILHSLDKGSFLDKLEMLGIVDITRSAKPVDDTSFAMLYNTEELKKTISLLSRVDFSNDKDYELLKKEVNKAGNIGLNIQDINAEFAKLSDLNTLYRTAKKEYEDLQPWGTIEENVISELARNGCKIRYYKISKKAFSEDWNKLYPIIIIKEDSTNVFFVTLSGESDYKFPIEEYRLPEGNIDSKKEEIDSIEKQIIISKSRLLKFKSGIHILEERYEASLQKLDYYLAKESSEEAAENTISVFIGFAPKDKEDDLCKEFDKMDLYYIKEDAKFEDNPPIKLKSNRFTEMFSVLTDMYGRPAYNEFDPTPYIAIFFLLFFAICMGDAGYGLVLAILGLFLKFKGGERSNFGPLVITLGVATFFVGIVLHTFFGVDLSTASFVPDWSKKIMVTGKIAGYDAQMMLSLVIGILHICLAMIVKTIYATKNNGFLNSLSTWGWTLLIVGAVITGGLGLTQIVDTQIIKWIIIAIAVISGLGIFIFNDLHRNPFANIGAGLWETYNTATGLLGDVLSYLRLYALGLAGGMLGSAFNNLAGIVLGDGGYRWIFFIIILVTGHALNIAMAALGAFVHPLRLNFLEFFKNSGYSGEGRFYKPIKNK